MCRFESNPTTLLPFLFRKPQFYGFAHLLFLSQFAKWQNLINEASIEVTLTPLRCCFCNRQAPVFFFIYKLQYIVHVFKNSRQPLQTHLRRSVKRSTKPDMTVMLVLVQLTKLKQMRVSISFWQSQQIVLTPVSALQTA